MENMLLQLFQHRIQVTRIGQQNVFAPHFATQHHVHSESKDMVQRQRTHKPDLVTQWALRQSRTVPLFTLQYISHNITVQQHSAFGHASRTPRVLQYGQIVQSHGNSLVGRGGLLRQRLLKWHSFRQTKGWHHFFHVAHHQVHDMALETHHVTHATHHHMLNRRMRDTLLQRVCKVLQNHNGTGARVLQLVL